MKRKKLITSFMIINFVLVGLFANTSADISAYDDNYEFLTFTDYGGGSTVSGKPKSVKLPIEAYYTPSFPYTFTLANVDNNTILSDDIYQTTVYEVGTVVNTEQFSLSVLGNEATDKDVDIHIDYEPYFYSKLDQSKSSNIPITYVEVLKISSDTSSEQTHTFIAGTIINNVDEYSSSYTRVPYILGLKNGPQNLLLLEFMFSWPLVDETNFPDGFYSQEELKSNVVITITT
jgi:hypothetical protein